VIALDTVRVAAQVAADLADDVGAGDITAELIHAESRSHATVLCRESMVLCGQAWFNAVFHAVDPNTCVHWLVTEGEACEAGQTLVRLEGLTRSLVTAERCALNWLQTLSATATTTRRWVDRVASTAVTLLDTRKTLPGLRYAQKHAVACGGGTNHRLGLFDAFLIKENHVLACGSLTAAVKQARAQHPERLLEVEVETEAELQEAVAAGVTRILLDNWGLDAIRSAVLWVAGRAELEASGNVTADTVLALAQAGVTYISIGALTKHLKAIDLSMRLVDA
jgi:nicotinate-nucleotide pyrophosphorylase (carboxylating)